MLTYTYTGILEFQKRATRAFAETQGYHFGNTFRDKALFEAELAVSSTKCMSFRSRPVYAVSQMPEVQNRDPGTTRSTHNSRQIVKYYIFERLKVFGSIIILELLSQIVRQFSKIKCDLN